MPDYLQLSKFYQFTTRRASKGRCRQPICEFRNNTMATMLKIIHYQRLRVHCFMFSGLPKAEFLWPKPKVSDLRLRPPKVYTAKGQTFERLANYFWKNPFFFSILRPFFCKKYSILFDFFVLQYTPVLSRVALVAS